MKQLTIIYHSQSAHTETLAQAVLTGARQESEVNTSLVKAFDAGLNELLHADGLIFGTPENFAYMSGALKDFFDRTYYPAQEHALNLPYALFISAGNDGSGAVMNIDRILKGYPMRKIAEPLISIGELSDTALAEAEELGQGMAAGLSLGIFGS